jgi:hypothetical protein
LYWRAAITGLVFMTMLAPAAEAGQSSANFNVGLVIRGKGRPARAPSLTYTWGAAAVSLLKAGYRDIRPTGRSATIYRFEAAQGGRRYHVTVSVATGGSSA